MGRSLNLFDEGGGSREGGSRELVDGTRRTHEPGALEEHRPRRSRRMSTQLTANGYYGRQAGQPRHQEAESIFDFQAIWSAVVRNWWVMAISVLVVVVAAIFYIDRQTPIYQATALVQIRPQNVQFANIDSVVSNIHPDILPTDTQVSIIRSDEIAISVIDALDLYHDPEFGQILTDNPEMTREEAALRLLGPFKGRLDVGREGGTLIIQIGYQSEFPTKAAKIANQVAATYLSKQVESKTSTAVLARDWLERRLAQLRADVEQAHLRSNNFRSEHGLENVRGETLIRERLGELNIQLLSAQEQQTQARSRIEAARSAMARDGNGHSIPEVVASALVSNLKARRAEITQAEAELLSRYGDRHPDVIRSREQGAEVDAQIAGEVQNVIRSLEAELLAADRRVSSIETSVEDAESELRLRNPQVVRLNELEADAEALQQLLNTLRQRYVEVIEQRDMQMPDAVVVSDATVPLRPFYPDKRRFVMFSLAWSIALGGALIYMIEASNKTLRAGQDFEDELNLPYFGSIPKVKAAQGSMFRRRISIADYVIEQPNSLFAEALKRLHARITALKDEDTFGGRSILFTSPMPREGKTTVATSFARLAASGGIQTVLVESDIRNPSIGQMFGIEPDAGLAEYLNGEASLEDVLYEDEVTGLKLLPARQPMDFAELLLGSAKLPELIETLEERYRMVVLDSPSVIHYSDALILARNVDTTIMLAWPYRSKIDSIRTSLKMFQDAGAQVHGGVVSGFRMSQIRRYSHENRYRYIRGRGESHIET